MPEGHNMVSALPTFGVFVLRSAGIRRNAQEDLSPPPYGVFEGTAGMATMGYL